MRLHGHLEDLIGVVCVARATSLGFHPILSCFEFYINCNVVGTVCSPGRPHRKKEYVILAVVAIPNEET